MPFGIEKARVKIQTVESAAERTKTLSIEELEVSGDLSADERELVNRYKLSNSPVKMYRRIKFGSETVLVILSAGIYHVCRDFVKSVEVLSEEIRFAPSGVPLGAYSKVKVTTLSGAVFENIGASPFKGDGPIAAKSAVTSGICRALKLAIGLPFQDESEARERLSAMIVEKKESSQ